MKITRNGEGGPGAEGRLALALCVLLIPVGFAIHRAIPLRARPAASPEALLRLHQGAATEEERLILARELAGLCSVRIEDTIDPDPIFVWGDFIPGGGEELAAAMRVSAGGGLLALARMEEGKLALAARFGPDCLGAPTSLEALALPDLPGSALCLTDLADQMAGAFHRRELGAILELRGGDWRRLWTREVESQAYWNKAWDTPPGHGWLRLAGTTAWQGPDAASGYAIIADYRNSLSEAPGGDRLPEEGGFIERREAKGRIVYRWDPGLGLFALGYARTTAPARLLLRNAGRLEELAILPAGAVLAVLADERTEPVALIGRRCLLQVWAEGRIGLVEPGILEWMAERPGDLLTEYLTQPQHQPWPASARPARCFGPERFLSLAPGRPAGTIPIIARPWTPISP